MSEKKEVSATAEYEKVFFKGLDNKWYFSADNISNFDNITTYINSVISERQSFEDIFILYSDGTMTKMMSPTEAISETQKTIVFLRSVEYTN